MGKLVVTEFATLDGVAQAPGGPKEDTEGGFPHGGWQGPLASMESGKDILANAQTMDALLLGRRTYEIFASYWPTASEDSPFTGLLNGAPKYVASRTLRAPLGWHGSTLLTGDLADAVTSVKARHEEVHVIGSLNLVQSLWRLGLIDRVTMWVYPLVLGTGKRVFDDGALPATLRLVDATTYANGVLKVAYEPAGAPTYVDLTEA